MYTIKIPPRFIEKLTYGLFLFSIALLVYYQLSLLLGTMPQSPFLEPDNYMYLIFAKLAIAQHSFSVSNPYLVFPKAKFFEAYGLFEVPVVLHYILPFLPLVWSFRIIQGIAVATIYIVTLLIARRVLKATPLNKAYRYLAYSLVLLNFTLMQASEILEWRGVLFITACQVLLLYLLAYLFTEALSKTKKVLVCAGILLLLGISGFMWSDYWVNFLAFVILIGVFIIYSKFGEISKNRLYKIAVIGIMLFCLAILLLEPYIQMLVSEIGIHLGFIGCTSNPLDLAEVQCLSLSNGLEAVALYTFFSVFMIVVFLYNKTIGGQRNRYEYFIVGIVALMLLEVPMALGYLRLIQLAGPFLSISFGLGLVGLWSYFARMGSNKLIMALMIFIIVLSAGYSVIVFGQATILLYHLDNSQPFVNVTGYLSNYPNSTTLAFFNYGDYLEAYGNQKVYADTVQQLDYNAIANYDMIFNESSGPACAAILSLDPIPQFVLLTTAMQGLTLFDNASANSLVVQPWTFSSCSEYQLVYQDQGWYVFRHD